MLKDFARPIPGVKFNESELLVKYPNENRVQLIGADNPDSLRGPGLSGLSLDEFSQIPPNVFGEILSKALADHLGYCIWSGTIKGHDQLFKLYQAAKDNSEWFALWQDIDESLATETGATITALVRAMEDDRKLVLQGVMTQAEFDQEWYLSPEAAIKGAIYGSEMSAARAAGRIASVPYDPVLPVDTTWDLGVGDATAIWFTQSLRSAEVRLIDYYEASGEGLPHYAKVLRERPYAYGTHTAPFDIEVKELGSGRTRLETARTLGIPFKIAPKLDLEDGIHAARVLFPRCWFDATKCQVGVEALAHYRRSYNTRLNEFTATPVHDIYSHGADAFRYLAVSQKVPTERVRSQWQPVARGAMDWSG
jgi:phage terminase large subunit